jgi:hypothetical protein
MIGEEPQSQLSLEVDDDDILNDKEKQNKKINNETDFDI